MSKQYKYVILGGGLVAGYAAQTFVEKGVAAGELAIISAEERPPYERPPLSKGFLAGEKESDELPINDPDFYEENGIALHLQTEVERVDLEKRQLFAGKKRIGYDKLLIATGSRIRPFDIPGADLDGLFYVRQVGDSEAVRHAATDAKRAVVVGGSFIGMEVSSVLQSAGIATTLVFPEARVWESFFTPQMSRFFESYYREKGVTLLAEAKVTGFKGENGRLTHTVLESGKELPADLVVAGIGVLPNSELFQDTPLKVEKNGILVNRFLETNVPGVFAAGDIATYPDQIYDKTKRIEHWDNAVAQGQHAARAMLGRNEVFDHIPYFFSDVFDLSYEFWGDTAGASQTIHRGKVDSGSFSVWWLGENGRLLAAFVMDRANEERDLAQRWIRSGAPVDTDDLADTSRALLPLIDDNSPAG